MEIKIVNATLAETKYGNLFYVSGLGGILLRDSDYKASMRFTALNTKTLDFIYLLHLKKSYQFLFKTVSL